MHIPAIGQTISRSSPLLRSAYRASVDVAEVRRITTINRLRPLTSRELLRLRDDAVERLGSAGYVGELALYAAIAGEIRDGWITRRYMIDVVIPQLNGSLHLYAGMQRTHVARHFADLAAVDVAYRIRGTWFGRDLTPIDLRSLMRQHDPEALFVLKSEGSRQGAGTSVVRASALFDPEFPPGPDAALQRYVDQHPSLQELSPSGVAPVRILTTSREGVVRTLSAMLRVGVRGERSAAPASGIVDGDRSIRLAVGLDGKVRSVGSDSRWGLHTAHPDTGRRFDGAVVPSLADAVRFAEALHARVPQLGLVGWDLAIDREGCPVLLEWNTVHPGVHYNEALDHPNYVGEQWELLR